MTKHLTIAALFCAAALTASAEGYQVNTFSARQEGMGHTGVAMKLGAESQLFNPGAMAFSEKTFEISGAMAAISAFATCTHDGVKYDTDNGISTPMNISTSWRILPRLYGGITFYTPYGSAINWGDNWPGAVLNQRVNIKVFTVQPTLSYRLLPSLSVGAGLMVSWGSVDLDKALVSGASLNRLMTAMGMPSSALYPDEAAPASVNLQGSSRLAVGYNIGALWDIDRHWSIGASFRSKMTMKVSKGQAAVSYSGAAQSMLEPVLDNLNRTNFSSSLPCPYVLAAGVAYSPLSNLTIAFDAQLNGWGTYRMLSIEFDELAAFDQHIDKNYHNAMTYHLGAQWGVTRRLDLRAGLMIDTSPCDKALYNPETPGQTRIEPSVGFSFRPVRGLSVDFAFMYVQGTGAKGTIGHYEDFAYKMAAQVNPSLPDALGLKPVGTFKADYSVHAFIPAIGISYSF